MNRKLWLLLLLLSFLWGGSFFFNELILRSVPPLTAVFGRTFIAAMVLLGVIRLRGLSLPRSPQMWGALAVMGLFNSFLPFVLIMWGQLTIDSGLASIINATSPLFSVLLAHFWTGDERLTPGRVAGIFLGMAGVVFLIGPESLQELGGQLWAQLAVLGASCCYAVAAVWGRRFKEVPAIVAAAGMLLCSAILVLPAALYVDQPWTLLPRADSLAALVALALLSTALAYQLYFHILAEAGATNILLVTFLIPITAVLLGALILGEPIGLALLGGMGLIFAGLLLVDGRIWLLLRRAADAA